MPQLQLSVDELVAAILRSHAVNIVVEGRDDIIAYRRVESSLNATIHGARLVSLFSAGGRANVLEVYRRLQVEDRLQNCLFVCDRDTWVFEDVPEQYKCDRIVFTDGYSIENDLIRDYGLKRLLTQSECAIFEREIVKFSEWFAYALVRARADGEYPLSLHVNEVIDNSRDRAQVEYSLAESREVGEHLGIILENQEKYLRGKSLLALYVRRLSAAGRDTKHSARSLLEHAAAHGGEHLKRIEGRLAASITAAQ